MPKRWLIVPLTLFSMSLASVTGALAAPRPTTSLGIPTDQVTAGASFTITFSSTKLPPGTVLALQKQVGTAHVWQIAAKLRGTTGTATVSGTLIGIHEYRLEAFRKNRVIAVSAPKRLYSYGPVTMTTICRAIQIPCSSGIETIGSTLYEYAEGPNAPGNTYPEWEQNGTFKADHTTCRSAAITFAFYKVPASGRAYVRLLQASAEPQEATTMASTEVGTFDVVFDGGPWYLSNATTNGSNVVMNGTFSCYTPTGL